MGAGADAGECSGNVAFARNGDAGCMAGNLVAAHVEAQCRANLTDDEPIAVMFDLVNPIGALQRERSPATRLSAVPDHDQFVVRFLLDPPSAALPN
jgi:hypothetical protein